jgi:ABC-2 type transport system ATP-binding protein
VRDHDRVIRLTGVGKRYRGGPEVLAGVDLEVPPGCPVSVVGGNGTGKSTLLRIVAGAASPSSGRVSGRPARIGYAPQAVPPPGRMTVLAYLRHHAAMHGVGGRDRARPALDLLDELGFTGRREGPVAELSTGNAQKVVLAQALGCGAALLVLDEPWAALDVAAVAALAGRLAAEAAEGRSLLLADHSGRAARLPAARTVRVVEGRLIEVALTEPAAGRLWSTVVLRCPADPARTLAALPEVSRSWDEDGLLGVCLPAERGDALLAAALGLGCSVVDVQQDTR